MTDSILILNDYCLLEFFKHLSVIDLANLKETYGSRLGAVAEMQFSRITNGFLRFDSEEKMGEDLRIIKQFGPSVSNLAIYYRSDGTKFCDIFSAISQYCNEKLKSLTLHGQSVRLITKADVLLIVDVLKNIETLKIGNSNSMAESVYILSHCVRAETIISYSNIDIVVHKTIFQRNKNLLKLELHSLIEENDLKAIVDNLMHTRLEALLLNIWKNNSSGENVAQLIRLNHLKRLTIGCGNVDISPFLRIVDLSNSLNVLSLSLGRLDETNIAALGRIKRLKVLEINFCMLTTKSHFKSLLVLCGNKNLEQLQFLCHRMDFKYIDGEKLRRMIETRKASTAEKCLFLFLSHKVYTESLNAIPSVLLDSNMATIKLMDSH